MLVILGMKMPGWGPSGPPNSQRVVEAFFLLLAGQAMLVLLGSPNLKGWVKALRYLIKLHAQEKGLLLPDSVQVGTSSNCLD